MSYLIDWHPKTIQYLRKLPHNISSRIVLKIKEIRDNPFRYLEHFEGDSIYKLRIGNYRALVDVEVNKKLILIQVLEHRKKIYKKK